MNYKDCRKMLWSILNLRALVLTIRNKNLIKDIDNQLDYILHYCDFIYDRIYEIEEILDEK